MQAMLADPVAARIVNDKNPSFINAPEKEMNASRAADY
jgi:hypothetical protein